MSSFLSPSDIRQALLCGPHPRSETGKIRTKATVTTVAILATSNGPARRAKVRANQSVDAPDRRHDSTSKWSAANVAYPSSCDSVLPPRSSEADCAGMESHFRKSWKFKNGPQMSAETAGTARTSRTSMKWASEPGFAFLRQPAQTCANLPFLPGGSAWAARYAIALRSQVGVPGPELRNTRKLGKRSGASCG